MTTSFNFSRALVLIRRYCFENVKLSLFSPLTLLGLLAVLFTFFLTASGETSYTANSTKNRAMIRTEIAKGKANTGSAKMYEGVVTNADAIRSVLQ